MLISQWEVIICFWRNYYKRVPLIQKAIEKLKITFFKIKFEYIKGIKNMLADTLGYLIK